MMIDVSDSRLYSACAVIILCPLIWNILARLCYSFIPRTATMQTRRLVCYSLALWIFLFSSYRDYLIRQAILNQPTLVVAEEHSNALKSVAVLMFITGQVFVLSSFYKLGVTGTFLGDYCGILMDAPLTSFPFNVLANPMYVGSTLSFLALGLFYSSPVGVVLAMEVYLVYRVALIFEEYFTKFIYERKAK